jgi:CHAT domain-containing protein
MTHRLLAFLLFATVLSPLAHAAESQPSMTAVYLHAWFPELGALDGLSAFERELVEAAALCRHGRFRTANVRFGTLRATASTARERYLFETFRLHAERQRWRYFESATLSPAYTGFAAGEPPPTAAMDAQRAALPQEDVTALELFLRGVDAMEAAPFILRNWAAMTDVVPDQEQPAAVKGIPRIRDLIFQIIGAAVADRVIEERDGLLLTHSVEAALARAGGDVDSAVRELDAALSIADAAGKPWLLLATGDVYLATRGTPLLLRFDAEAAGLLRTALQRGTVPWSLLPPSPKMLTEAARRYDAAAAAASGNDELLEHIALRRALIEFSKLNVPGAIEQYSKVAKARSGRVAWSAAAAAGLLHNEPRQFHAALQSAAAENDEGALASFTEMALTHAALILTVGKTPGPVIELLEWVTDTLEDIRRPRLLAIALQDLGNVYGLAGRFDASVVAVRRAQALVTANIARLSADPALQRDTHAERLFYDKLESLRHMAAANRAAELREGGWAAEGAAVAAGLEESIQRAIAGVPVSVGGREVLAAQTTRMEYELKIAVDEARAIPDCSERLPRLKEIRRRASTAGLRGWLLRFDILNADCDADQLAATRAEIERADPLASFKAHFAATRSLATGNATSDDFENVTEIALAELDVLRTAGAWQSLSTRLEALRTFIAADRRMAPLRVAVEQYRSMVAFEVGKPRQAIEIARAVMNEEGWALRAAPERVSLMLTLLDAEIDACHARPAACDAAAILFDFESLNHLRREWQMVRSGVLDNYRLSAEQAALEGRLARAATMDAHDLARLRNLRQLGRDAIAPRHEAPTREGIQKVVREVPTSSVLLVYLGGRKRLAACRVDGGKAQLVRISESRSVTEALVAELETVLTSPVDAEWREMSRKAFDVFVAPVLRDDRDRRLVIVASAPLTRLPLEVLRQPNGRTLGSDHSIVYTATLRRGEASARRALKKGAVVGVAGGTLPEAEAEAHAVARILGTEALIGEEATVANVTEHLARADVIHLAAHTTLVADNPFESHLVLSGGDRLEAWRLFRDAPAARLITLSACDTAAAPRALRGDVAMVAESVSIAALVAAGSADYVLASLWHADDRLTSLLMEHFYRGVRGGMDEATALRNAKRAIGIDRDLHPYYFANFILSARDLAAAFR